MRLDFLDILFLLLLFHREPTQNISMLFSYGIFAFSPLWGGLLFSPPHPYLLQSRREYALENTPILGYKIDQVKIFAAAVSSFCPDGKKSAFAGFGKGALPLLDFR